MKRIIIRILIAPIFVLLGIMWSFIWLFAGSETVGKDIERAGTELRRWDF